MNAYDRLPDAAAELFGPEATAAHAYDLLTVDVPPGSWTAALETARDRLGCTYFDWLSAVDEPGTGFRVCAHVAALEVGTVRRLLLRTTVPYTDPRLATAVGVYAGAGWHERETHEMFGVVFDGHPDLTPLLLPENFEGHPLRKDFVLAARVAKAWPGAKEPGESEHGGPKRRQMLPPGVPDPNEWGPLKGQLPPAPARPARTPRAAGAAGAADRPVRRTRTVSEDSASRSAAPGTGPAGEGAPAAPAAPVRRSRSASEGSASQTAAGTTGTGAAPGTPEAGTSGAGTPGAGTPGAGTPGSGGSGSGASGESAPAAPAAPARRSRSASQGSASQAAAPAAPAENPSAAPGKAAPGETTQGAPDELADESAPTAPVAPARSTDAPWHQPRPAFDGEASAGAPAPETPGPGVRPGPETAPAAPGSPEETTTATDTEDDAERPDPDPERPDPGPEPSEPAEPPRRARPEDTDTPAGGDPA